MRNANTAPSVAKAATAPKPIRRFCVKRGAAGSSGTAQERDKPDIELRGGGSAVVSGRGGAAGGTLGSGVASADGGVAARNGGGADCRKGGGCGV